MPKYRKKPVVIEATPWFRNGDHLVVGYYRTPECDGQEECSHCGRIMHDHGWIDTLERGYIVCPGDWIITGVQGEYYLCKPDIFEETYEEVE
jgi:hypothetical protein